MKKGWWIALGLLLVGFVFAYFWYQRQEDKAAREPNGTALKPRLEVGSVEITDIDEDKIDVNMGMLIDNPLPVSFKAKKVDFALYIDTALVAEDTYNKAIEVKSDDSTLITVPTQLLAKRLLYVLDQLYDQKVDSTNYKLRTTFDLDVPILGERTFSVTTEKKLPTYYLPKIKIRKIDFGKIGLKETDLAVTADIENRNAFPYNFTDTQYIVSIDGDVVAEGSQPEPILIKKQGVTPVVFPVKLKPGKFDNVAIKALFDKKNTAYLVDFRCKILDKDKNSSFHNSKMVTKIRGTLADLKKQ